MSWLAWTRSHKSWSYNLAETKSANFLSSFVTFLFWQSTFPSKTKLKSPAIISSGGSSNDNESLNCSRTRNSSVKNLCESLWLLGAYTFTMVIEFLKATSNSWFILAMQYLPLGSDILALIVNGPFIIISVPLLAVEKNDPITLVPSHALVIRS